MFGTTARLAAVLLGAVAAQTLEPVELRPIAYHAHLTRLDASGIYHWAGALSGSTDARAEVDASFDAGTIPGGMPVRTHWRVTMKPDSLSFEASLSGVVDPRTGRTHLIGAIIRGHGRGQMVETASQWANRGPDGTLSTNGVMTIWPPYAPPPTYASRQIISLRPQP